MAFFKKTFGIFEHNSLAFGPTDQSLAFTYFLKKGQSRPLFVYFRPFLITISIILIEKGIDGVHGIRTRGRRMVGTFYLHVVFTRFNQSAPVLVCRNGIY